MAHQHEYQVQVEWTGNTGEGTKDYRSYSRNHEIKANGKSAAIAGSSDPKFRGDGTRYNPEELFVSALSTCHMLWMLHLCADAGIKVSAYSDEASGMMIEHEDGSGEFIDVVLRPRMIIDDVSKMLDAMELHEKAHDLCFIARSVKCRVRHEPVVAVEE